MSRFNDSDRYSITNSNIGVNGTVPLKKHLFSYQFKNYFSHKKTVNFLKQIAQCHGLRFRENLERSIRIGSDRNKFELTFS